MSLQYGQRARGFNVSFVEPYFLDYRLAFGADVFAKQTTSSQYLSYLSKTIGGDIKFGVPIAENISTQARWTVYDQAISLPAAWKNCNDINPDFVNTWPTPNCQAYFEGLEPVASGASYQQNCYADGEASLAVRKELAQGPVLVSAPGYTLAYNTLDNNRNPTSGMIIDFRQDLAGAGGDVKNLKTIIDTRMYNEIYPDIVGLLRIQGGFATGWGGEDLRCSITSRAGRIWCAASHRPASDRATLRSCPMVILRPMRSAVRCTGRPRWSFKHRCSSLRRTSV